MSVANTCLVLITNPCTTRMAECCSGNHIGRVKRLTVYLHLYYFAVCLERTWERSCSIHFQHLENMIQQYWHYDDDLSSMTNILNDVQVYGVSDMDESVLLGDLPYKYK